MPVLVDNDVLIKLARYGMLDALEQDEFSPVAILGTARYVVRSRLQPFPQAAAKFEQFLATATELEPTEEEVSRAVGIQDAAAQHGVPVDGGETLLFVLAARDAGAAVLTGDRRAVAGAESLLDDNADLASVAGRVRCLEQLFADELRRGRAAVKSCVCSAADADRTLSICFSCSHGRDDRAEQLLCLDSYISAARAQAPRLLAEA